MKEATMVNITKYGGTPPPFTYQRLQRQILMLYYLKSTKYDVWDVDVPKGVIPITFCINHPAVYDEDFSLVRSSKCRGTGPPAPAPRASCKSRIRSLALQSERMRNSWFNLECFMNIHLIGVKESIEDRCSYVVDDDISRWLHNPILRDRYENFSILRYRTGWVNIAEDSEINRAPGWPISLAGIDVRGSRMPSRVMVPEYFQGSLVRKLVQHGI